MHESEFFKVFPVIVVYIVFFIFLMRLISRLSGWHVLAKRFPLRHPFMGKAKRFQSANINWGAYNNCLTIGMNHMGLYMAVIPFFSSGHPPIFIGWDSVRKVSKEKLMSTDVLSFEIVLGSKVLKIRMRWALAEEFQDVLSGRFFESNEKSEAREW